MMAGDVAVMGTGFWHGEIWGQIPNLLGEGNGTPLQYSCLENPMDRGAWWATVQGFEKSQRRLSDFSFTHWRRQWQPTPVFLPRESHGRRSLVGYCPWGRKESETTEQLHLLLSFYYVLVTEPKAIQAIPHSIPTAAQGGWEHYSSCLCVRDGKNQGLEGLLICVKSEWMTHLFWLPWWLRG